MPPATRQTAQRKLGERIACLMGLQRAFGECFKEFCQPSPKRAVKGAHKHGRITLDAGTKGGKKRTLPYPCRMAEARADRQACEIPGHHRAGMANAIWAESKREASPAIVATK